MGYEGQYEAYRQQCWRQYYEWCTVWQKYNKEQHAEKMGKDSMHKHNPQTKPVSIDASLVPPAPGARLAKQIPTLRRGPLQSPSVVLGHTQNTLDMSTLASVQSTPRHSTTPALSPATSTRIVTVDPTGVVRPNL